MKYKLEELERLKLELERLKSKREKFNGNIKIIMTLLAVIGVAVYYSEKESNQYYAPPVENYVSQSEASQSAPVQEAPKPVEEQPKVEETPVNRNYNVDDYYISEQVNRHQYLGNHDQHVIDESHVFSGDIIVDKGIEFEGYYNEAFGYRIQVPLSNTSVSTGSYGELYVRRNDGSLNAMISSFTDSRSLDEIYSLFKNSAEGTIAYKTKKNNWFVISTEMATRGYYVKVMKIGSRFIVLDMSAQKEGVKGAGTIVRVMSTSLESW